MPLSEAEKWLDHLGSCSPCYADFKRLQEAQESRRRRTLLATAAGIILAVAFIGWALVHKRNEDLIAQAAVLDLRDRSLPRGTESNPNEQPLEVSHRVTSLRFLMPLGSSAGRYDVRIVTLAGQELVATSGTASANDGISSLQVSLRLDSFGKGKYILQIRKPESDWLSYVMVLK
jgi:hypothetical protein